MQIKIDSDGIITDFSVLGGLAGEGVIEVNTGSLPMEFLARDADGNLPLLRPGEWKYENGKVMETGEAKPEPQNPTASLEQQVADLQLAVVELYEEVLGNG